MIPITTIAGGLLILTGLWLVFRAFRSRSRRLALLRNVVKKTGVVVRFDDTTTDGDVVATRAPIVQYEAEDGRSYELRLPPQQDAKLQRVGSKLPVFYERGQPSNATHVLRTWDVNLALVLSFLPLLIGAGLIYTDYQDTAPPAAAGE